MATAITVRDGAVVTPLGKPGGFAPSAAASKIAAARQHGSNLATGLPPLIARWTISCPECIQNES
jgi:hypothetical protein